MSVRTSRLVTLVFGLLSLLGAGSAFAQPFACTGEAFIIQNQMAELRQVDQSVNPFAFSPVIGSANAFEINALGFNPADGLLYGWRRTAPQQVVSIDSTGSVTLEGVPTGLTVPAAASAFTAGDVTADGTTMYLNFNGTGTLWIVDLGAFTATSIAITGASGRVVDWAAHPTNGLLYGGDDTGGQLAVLNPATGVRTDSSVGGGGLPTGSGYGGAWFDATGQLFLYRNNGEIFEIDVSVPTVDSMQSGGPASSFNDGAACIQSVIGAAKQMTTTNTGLPATVTIDYVFENFTGSSTTLDNLSAIEDLEAVFGTQGVDWTFGTISSTPMAFANGSFDGAAPNTELVATSQSLTEGSTASITVTLQLLTLAALDINMQYCNQVLVTGETPAGNVFGDLSTDGTDPDGVDGDGSPDERTQSCIDEMDIPVRLMTFDVD